MDWSNDQPVHFYIWYFQKGSDCERQFGHIRQGAGFLAISALLEDSSNSGMQNHLAFATLVLSEESGPWKWWYAKPSFQLEANIANTALQC